MCKIFFKQISNFVYYDFFFHKGIDDSVILNIPIYIGTDNEIR